MTSIMTLTTPVAGWLTKMISLPFGRSRWISRYFVLLDSELRFYKDEVRKMSNMSKKKLLLITLLFLFTQHSDSASQIMNLRNICQVIPTPTTQHPFCFRLEPQQSYTSDSVTRPWIIECKSEMDMENWISAIQSRIDKYNNSTSSSPNMMTTPPPPPPPPSSDRIVSSYSMMNNTFPEFYRVATLPLRCTNLTLDNEEVEEKESLLMRRKKKLAPIVTQMEEEVSYYQSPPSTCSSLSLISPTGAVLGTLISPSIIDRYSQYKHQTNSQTIVIPEKETTRCESPSSPTYLMYKKKFHL
jgi:hypothetical protein